MNPYLGHVVALGNWGAEFRCTPLVMQIFKERKIFFGVINELPLSMNETLKFDNSVELEPHTFFPSPHIWSTKSFSYSWSTLTAGINVGRYTSIGHKCNIIPPRHPVEWATTSPAVYAANNRYSNELKKEFNITEDHHEDPALLDKITTQIGHDVWIGWNSQIGRQVTIGTGAVIATGSIVTKNVEPYMIVGGVPARVIRPRFSEKIIERMLQSEWWQYSPDVINACDYKNPEKFLDDIEAMKEDKKKSPFCPPKTTCRDVLKDLETKLQQANPDRKLFGS